MAKAKQQAGAEAPSFIVKSPLSHDQKDYAAGDSVGMSEEQAAPLLSLKVLERPGVSEAPEIGDDEPGDDPQ